MRDEGGESRYEFRKRWFKSEKTGDERKAEIAEIRRVVEIARRRPCTDCGIELPASCIDFDHTRGTPLFGLTTFNARSFSLECILEELDKCDIRCPTCHRLRHYWLRNSDDPYFIDHPPYPSWLLTSSGNPYA